MVDWDGLNLPRKGTKFSIFSQISGKLIRFWLTMFWWMQAIFLYPKAHSDYFVTKLANSLTGCRWSIREGLLPLPQV